MTQFSFPWGCDALGDGGPSSFSLDVVIDMNMFLNNLDPTIYGVIPWGASPYAGLLAATNPGGDTVRIASGVGMVEGWLYTNDANVDFDVSGGAANATDLIVLRRSNPGAAPQTVRLALVRGPAAGIATVTQTTGVFEIALWEVELDAGGSFSALNDVREYVHTPLMTDADHIDNRTRNLQIYMSIDYDEANYPDINQYGWLMLDAATRSLYGGFKVPDDYVSGGVLKVIGEMGAGAAGNMYWNFEANFGAIGEQIDNTTVSSLADVIAVAADLHIIKSMTLTGIDGDDYCWIQIEREGGNLLDTSLNTAYIVSVLFEYTADS